MADEEKKGPSILPTGLRAVLDSSIYLTIRLAFLLLNVIILALYEPLEFRETGITQWFTAINVLVDVYCVVDFLLFVISRSGYIGTTRIAKLLDHIGTAAAVTDIILLIVLPMVKLDFNEQDVFEIVRLIRMVKIGCLFNKLPSMGGKSVTQSAYQLIINIAFPVVMMLAFALMTTVWVSDKLSYRCVPTSTNATLYQDYPYYVAYGDAFYTSFYNTDFCGAQACDANFECTKGVVDGYKGVFGDFSTPWTAFVTNTSFLTTRGWPNIFWALKATMGPITAAVIFFILFGVGALLVLNMVVAIFIQFFKAGYKYLERRFWLKNYPGNLATVTELELVLWARRNNRELSKLSVGRSVRSFRGIFRSLLAAISDSGNVGEDGEQEDGGGGGGDKEAVTGVGEDLIDHGKAGRIAVKVPPPAKEKVTLCVPKMAIFKLIRAAALNRTSFFNKVVTGLLFIDLFLFGMNSRTPNGHVNLAIETGNTIICAIFVAELALLVVSFGPFRFFNSFFNIGEAVVIIVAITSVPDGLCPYANIFRLLRLLRVPSSNAKQREFRFGSFASYADRWIRILNEVFEFIGFNMILLLALVFLYAIIGMRVFPHNQRNSLLGQSPVPYNQLVPDAPLVQVEYAWWGRVVTQYSFTNFTNAYLAIFNIGYLNSWYTAMIAMTIQTEKNRTFFYYLTLIFITTYVIAPVLTARILVVIDKQVSQLVRNAVDRNNDLLERCVYLRKKVQMHRAFQKLLTQQTASEAATEAIKTKLAIPEESEDSGQDTSRAGWLKSEFQRRSGYSFYLFAPINSGEKGVSYFLYRILRDRYFEFIVFFAMMATVVDVLADNQYNKGIRDRLQAVIAIIFYIEMVIKMVAYGWWLQPGGYFFSPINIMDFILNGMLLFTLFSGNNIIQPFLIIRIFKFPTVMDKLVTSTALERLVKATRKAAVSLVSLTILFLFVVFFFAVFGLQLWRQDMFYCTTTSFTPFVVYPGDVSRYAHTASFPNGCSGSKFGYALRWTPGLDTYNNIFAASQTIFRVMMMNNWAGLMYLSMEARGYDVQPSLHTTPPAFIFYFILAFVAMVLNVLFACVIYYHYLVETLTEGKSLIVNQDNVTMNELKSALKYVGPKFDLPHPGPDSWAITRFLHGIIKKKRYQWFSCTLALAPILLILAFFNETYRKDYMVWYDSIYSGFYIFEYLIRMFVFGPRKFLSTLTGRQEMYVIIALVVQIILAINLYHNGSHGQAAHEVTLVCVILRMYRLSWVFPVFGKLLKVLTSCLSGFFPVFTAIICVMLFYAVVGKYCFGATDLDYDPIVLGSAYKFYRENYNFKSYYNSFFTLMSMATGNVWSEVVSGVRKGKGDGVAVAVGLYFLTFNILINCSLRAFVILLISRFLDHSGTSITFAEQQVNVFRHAWAMSGASETEIDDVQLKRMLLIIKAPFGIANPMDKNYAMLNRFILKIKRAISFERLLDFEDTRPLGNRKMKFNEVLVALHRLAIFNTPSNPKEDQAFADDEELFRKLRVRGVELKSFLIVQTAHDLSEAHLNKIRDINLRAVRKMQLLQRFSSELYNETFLRLTSNMFFHARQSITSYGLSDIDAFVVKYIRRAVKNEIVAARFQYLKYEAWQRAGSTNAESKMFQAGHFYKNLLKIGQGFDELYNKNVEQEWDFRTVRTVKTIELPKAYRSPITAVHIDNNNSVYIATAAGRVMEWKSKRVSRLFDDDEKFTVADQFELKDGEIRALATSSDCDILYVGWHSDIVAFVRNKSRRGGGGGRKVPRKLREAFRLKYHTAVLNCLLFHDKYLISAGNDGKIVLWPSNSQVPARRQTLGTAIFCVAIIENKSRNQLTSEKKMGEVLLCGMQSGKLVALAMPLTSGTSEVWPAAYFEGTYGCGAVTALAVQWGYTYVGCEDGGVFVLSFQMDMTRPNAAPIDCLASLKLRKVQCHSGAVTRLLSCGGGLISTSFDYSTLIWERPEVMNAKSEAEFRQETGTGNVFHSARITCASANGFAVVSGDDMGQVVVAGPTHTQESLVGGGSTDLESNVRNHCHFSFLEHDFKECFMPQKGITIVEEVILNVLNSGAKPMTLRAASTAPGVFGVRFDTNVLKAAGCIVRTITTGPTSKTMVEVPPQTFAQYRLTFFPSEADKIYRGSIEFSVDEREVVSIDVKGFGIKPSLRLEEPELVDFDNVKTGDYMRKTLTVVNSSLRDFVVSFRDEDKAHRDGTVERVLHDKGITIDPPCFVVPAQSSVLITVEFRPPEEIPTRDFPLRFIINGVPHKLATLRLRSIGDGGNEPRKLFPPLFKGELLKPRDADENFADPAIINRSLSFHDWGAKLSVTCRMACLQHRPTGMFVELLSASVSPESLLQNDSTSVTVDQRCRHEGYCELWFEDRLVTPGKTFKADEHVRFAVTAAFLDSVSHNGTEKKDRYGVLQLELFTWSKAPARNMLTVATKPGGYQANLLSVSTVAIVKGIRMFRQSDGRYGVQPRLDVVGISRIISYASDGNVVLLERFDHADSENTKAIHASSHFGEATLQLRPKDGATYVEVEEVVGRGAIAIAGEGVSVVDQSIWNNAKSRRYFNASNARDGLVIHFHAPDIAPQELKQKIAGRRLFRGLNVQFSRDKIDIANFRLGSRRDESDQAILETHLVHFEGDAAPIVPTSGGLSQNYGNSMLPHAVHTRSHGVSVTMTESSMRQTEFTQLQNGIRAGFGNDLTEPGLLGSHHDEWCFLLKGSALRLVQAKPGASAAANRLASAVDGAPPVEEAKEQESVVNGFASRIENTEIRRAVSALRLDVANDDEAKEEKKADEESSQRREVAAGEPQVPTELTLYNFGVEIRRGEETAVYGVTLPSQKDRESTTVVISNVLGETTWMEKQPTFLKEICALEQREAKLISLKAAFRKLSEKPEFTTMLEAEAEKEKQKDKKVTFTPQNDDDGEEKDHDDGLDPEVRDSLVMAYKRAYKVLVFVTNRFADELSEKEQADQQATVAAAISRSRANTAASIANSIVSRFSLTGSAAQAAPRPDEQPIAVPATAKSTAKKKVNPNSIANTRLHRVKLHLYLSQKTLPGFDKPLLPSFVALVCDHQSGGLPSDAIDIFSPEAFVSWCLHSPLRSELQSLTDHTVFARLLEEEREAVLHGRAVELQVAMMDKADLVRRLYTVNKPAASSRFMPRSMAASSRKSNQASSLVSASRNRVLHSQMVSRGGSFLFLGDKTKDGDGGADVQEPLSPATLRLQVQQAHRNRLEGVAMLNESAVSMRFRQQEPPPPPPQPQPKPLSPAQILLADSDDETDAGDGLAEEEVAAEEEPQPEPAVVAEGEEAKEAPTEPPVVETSSAHGSIASMGGWKFNWGM